METKPGIGTFGIKSRRLSFSVWEKVVVSGTETIFLSSSSNQASLKSSKSLSVSLENILSQYHRLSELESNLETFQSKLISIQISSLWPGALGLEKDPESRLCGFIPVSHVLSFLLLPVVNLLHT